VSEPGLSSINVVASAIDASLLDFGGHTSPDGAITLMLTDVEDARALPPDVLRDHATLVRQLVGAHDGSVAGQSDDGFMASFGSAHSALRCAIELQKAFADSELKPRVGLHSGFLIADADAFYGRNVVLAARIADRAKGREILVSDALREYTSTDPTFAFEDRGRARLKGLLGTHHIHAVSWQR
jgi:class 3 adenylate cyclase